VGRENSLITSLHEKFRWQTEARRHLALSQSRTPGRGINAANFSDCGLIALSNENGAQSQMLDLGQTLD
jgi:hypothetical protein